MFLEILIDKLDFYTLTLKDETGAFIELDLSKELGVNEYILEQEMLQQPAKYVYWSAILERIRYFQEQKELEHEVLLGRLDKEAREELKLTTDRVTKDAVDGYIKRTEEYTLSMEQINHYKYLVRRLQFIVKSFEQRKDMLQSFNKAQMQDKSYGHHAGRYHENN